MANISLVSLICTLLLASCLLNCHCQEDDRKVHVVYMGDRLKEGVSVASHHSILADVLGSHSLAKESLIHSYGRSFNGFVARLSNKEVASLKDMEGVVSVFPNSKLQLHTTRSWDFMGFPESHPIGSFEGDVIIGLLDTGIWPENPSFIDEGFGPPPAKWNGTCQGANNFTCNNKVIGARFYDLENSFDPRYDIKSPRDTFGHGSHTASTAAGTNVHNASYFGIANGVARGAVPGARIAVYKVCWATAGCTDADILAAFDDAIADGVDILSVSLGNFFPLLYLEDSIAIGSFHAMKNGILVSASAGNNGPYRREISNYAPWMLTVAASTIDRKFISKLALGNGQTILGTSLNIFDLKGATFPLVYSGDAGNVTLGVGPELATWCYAGTLNTVIAKGGIILCEEPDDGSVVTAAGAVGIIMPFFTDVFAIAFPVPATIVSYDDYDLLLDYIRTTENPIATILPTEIETDHMAPTVVSFSSRGPSPISPNILKPDITAPGSNILAAWSPLAGASVGASDDRITDYYIISGTSMSCPHAAGLATYIKSFHPTWSPAAIKSAIMTTATIMDPRKNEDAEFSYGAGHINPSKAADPGLVYDATEADYVAFLCNEGYNNTFLRMVTGDDSVCPDTHGKSYELNYPSFSLPLLDGEPIAAAFPRTVTNVGSPNSTYTANVTMPPSFTVIVEPSVLTFSAIGETKPFTLKVSGTPLVQEPIVSGDLVWTDGYYEVRSPIVVYNNIPSFWASLPDENPNTLEGSTFYHNNGMANHPTKKNSHLLKGSAINHKNGIFLGN